MQNLNESRLVQRLEKPRGNTMMGNLANAFSFGGGLLNGGLSNEAFDLLRNIFSFDYMGAAEFEFGAVPKALQTIAQNAGHLEAFTIQFPLSQVKEPWAGRPQKNAKKKEKVNSLAEIFVIAPKEWRNELAVRIKGWACEDYNRGLKESTRLNTALRPVNEWQEQLRGWLELDNGYFFFTDRDMFKQVAELFGVKTGQDGSVIKLA